MGPVKQDEDFDAFPSVQPGDILYEVSRWGRDQTNRYKVQKTSDRCVWLYSEGAGGAFHNSAYRTLKSTYAGRVQLTKHKALEAAVYRASQKIVRLRADIRREEGLIKDFESLLSQLKDEELDVEQKKYEQVDGSSDKD